MLLHTRIDSAFTGVAAGVKAEASLLAGQSQVLLVNFSKGFTIYSRILLPTEWRHDTGVDTLTVPSAVMATRMCFSSMDTGMLGFGLEQGSC